MTFGASFHHEEIIFVIANITNTNGWWLNQPLWKICASQFGSFPFISSIFGVTIPKMFQTLGILAHLLRMVMEPKYNAFRSVDWTYQSSAENMTIHASGNRHLDNNQNSPASPIESRSCFSWQVTFLSLKTQQPRLVHPGYVCFVDGGISWDRFW